MPLHWRLDAEIMGDTPSSEKLGLRPASSAALTDFSSSSWMKCINSACVILQGKAATFKPALMENTSTDADT
jgi:hypothetical protein